jgi:NAD-dependent dihydropyrimidine dehydrogenase PreA subunit
MNNGRGYGGRGCGRGRGRGHGFGDSGSTGQSIGRGRGNGRRGGRCQGSQPLSGPWPAACQPRDAAHQANALRTQVQDMRGRLGAITRRIAGIEAAGTDASSQIEQPSKIAPDGSRTPPRITAVINREQCICCGLCLELCPERAISMNDIVTIDPAKCTGCGSCVKECPNEALYLIDAAHLAAQRQSSPTRAHGA